MHLYLSDSTRFFSSSSIFLPQLYVTQNYAKLHQLLRKHFRKQTNTKLCFMEVITPSYPTESLRANVRRGISSGHLCRCQIYIDIKRTTCQLRLVEICIRVKLKYDIVFPHVVAFEKNVNGFVGRAYRPAKTILSMQERHCG